MLLRSYSIVIDYHSVRAVYFTCPFRLVHGIPVIC